MYTPIPIELDNKQKPIQCELLGERIKEGKSTYNTISGLLPIAPEISDILEDPLLSGKLYFFEKGFIFDD